MLFARDSHADSCFVLHPQPIINREVQPIVETRVEEGAVCSFFLLLCLLISVYLRSRKRRSLRRRRALDKPESSELECLFDPRCVFDFVLSSFCFRFLRSRFALALLAVFRHSLPFNPCHCSNLLELAPGFAAHSRTHLNEIEIRKRARDHNGHYTFAGEQK
mgnify:CR=1 FL=1